jgi:hypothetical protein
LRFIYSNHCYLELVLGSLIGRRPPLTITAGAGFSPGEPGIGALVIYA